MAKEVDPKDFDLIVLSRTGYGEDWFPCYEPKKDMGEKNSGKVKGRTLPDHKAACIAYIREHRNGDQGFEYRIKDTVSGAILD